MAELVADKGKVWVKCKCCKKDFQARIADRNRGWGKFCNKSCKAKEQERRTGQYKSYLCNRTNGIFKTKTNDVFIVDKRSLDYDSFGWDATDHEGLDWDAHKGSF